MSEPIAYFITFRCYGTWLHGDRRGSVDRDSNIPFTPLLPPDERRERKERGRLAHSPVVLNPASRRVIERTIREVVAHRGWDLHALNARTNPVHIVVTADRSAERVMNDFKSWCTRRLREAGLFAPDVRPWVYHGSTQYVWTPADLLAVCQYVLEEQDQRQQDHGPLPDGRGSELT